MTIENKTIEMKNERSECDYCKRTDRGEKIIISSPRFDYDGPLILHEKCNEALFFYGLLLRDSNIKDGHKLVELANWLAGVQIKTRNRDKVGGASCNS